MTENSPNSDGAVKNDYCSQPKSSKNIADACKKVLVTQQRVYESDDVVAHLPKIGPKYVAKELAAASGCNEERPQKQMAAQIDLVVATEGIAATKEGELFTRSSDSALSNVLEQQVGLTGVNSIVTIANSMPQPGQQEQEVQKTFHTVEIRCNLSSEGQNNLNSKQPRNFVPLPSQLERMAYSSNSLSQLGAISGAYNDCMDHIKNNGLDDRQTTSEAKTKGRGGLTGILAADFVSEKPGSSQAENNPCADAERGHGT